jgi:hypothetical protein
MATDDGGLGEVVDELAEIEPFNLDDIVAGGEAGGPPDGADDLADLADVFAPVTLAVELTTEPGGAPAEAEPDPAAERPAIDWAEAIGGDRSPIAAAAPRPDEAAGADEPIRWPTFVGHTSDLMDRGTSGLFDRLRAAKHALVVDGRVAIDRSIGRAAPVVLARLGEADEAEPLVVARPRLAAVDGEPVSVAAPHANGVDLTAMRVRLIESETAAAEIASTLESAIADGDADPLALRVLGEAYLRLGRTEQAAAQFRQAMLARRRVR